MILGTFALVFALQVSAQVDAGVAQAVHDAGARDVARDAGAPVAVHEASAPIAVHDGGAASPDGGAPREQAPALPDAGKAEAFPARVHEEASPLVFRVPLGKKEARTRALEAGAAITSALEVEDNDVPPASVQVGGDTAVVRVHGQAVATLTVDDARAEGSPSLEQYAAELQTRLTGFVHQEARRSSLQSLAFHVFLSVVLALLALLTVRALRTAFARFEAQLEESEHLKAFNLLGIQLLSGEAWRGLLLVALFVGRILAYVVIAVAALVSVFTQFDTTRPWIGRVGAWALSPVVTGAEALVRAVPGVLLAAALLVAAAAALRFVRLWLHGIAVGHVTSKAVKARQASAVRALASGAIILVAAPLAVAAAFARFGTPLETLTLAAGGVVLLAGAPVVASALVGLVLAWRGTVRVGDWIAVGRGERAAHGEVTMINTLDVVLVPAEGGTVVVPMLALAFAQVQRSPRSPDVHVPVRVKRDRALAEIEAALLRCAKSVDAHGEVELTRAAASYVDVEITAPCTKQDARAALVRALLTASEANEIVLLDP